MLSATLLEMDGIQFRAPGGCIYVVTDGPSNEDRVLYVGKTVDTAIGRLRSHVRDGDLLGRAITKDPDNAQNWIVRCFTIQESADIQALETPRIDGAAKVVNLRTAECFWLQLLRPLFNSAGNRARCGRLVIPEAYKYAFDVFARWKKPVIESAQPEG